MSKDKIVALIIKLKALSENNNSVEEASLAAARMQALIAEHQISMAEIQDHDEEEKEDFEHTVAHEENGPNVISWKLHLIGALAKNNLCRYSYTKGGRARNASYTIYGKPSNIQIVTYMFSFLTREIDRLCKDEMNKAKREGYYGGKSFSNSFRLGAVSTISERMSTAKKQRFDTATSTALVRLDNEGRDLSRWMRNNFSLRSATRNVSNSNGYAYQRGREAGHSISLNSGRSIGTGPKSLR